jgi:hypothetical protein
MGVINFEIRRTIQNKGLGRRAVTNGVDATREYLGEIGATGGQAWSPLVRSRLYAEMRHQGVRGTFQNMVGGTALIGSMDQSFAPSIPEAVGRFNDRAGTMPRAERARRLGSNVLQQRVLMPPVMQSLKPMRRVAWLTRHDPHVFANLYAEELPEGETYNNINAPYVHSAQLTPDVVEKLDTTISDLPGALLRRGITRLSFSPYDAARKSQSGQTELPAWDLYLPSFAGKGLIRQVVIPLNRDDLPPASGVEAMSYTHRLADELVKDTASPGKLGALPDQIACIVRNRPAGQVLDLTIGGNVSGLPPEQLQNVYGNLQMLVESTAV